MLTYTQIKDLDKWIRLLLGFCKGFRLPEQSKAA